MIDAGDFRLNHVLCESPAIVVGRFVCHPDSPEFSGPRRIPVSQVIFPERSVGVRRECGRRFLVDPTMAAIYRRGEAYERERIGDFEDRHYWIGFRREGHGPEDHGPPRAFVWKAGQFRARQRFFRRLESGAAPDALELEESAVALVDAVLSAKAAGQDNARGRYGDVEPEIAEAVKARIAGRPEERVTLDELAVEFGLSPFALHRAFRAFTGWTIHRYATETRLRLAWSLLGDTTDSITDIALATGFSSHSHFTASFRRRFGLRPSRHPARG